MRVLEFRIKSTVDDTAQLIQHIYNPELIYGIRHAVEIQHAEPNNKEPIHSVIVAVKSLDEKTLNLANAVIQKIEEKPGYVLEAIVGNSIGSTEVEPVKAWLETHRPDVTKTFFVSRSE